MLGVRVAAAPEDEEDASSSASEGEDEIAAATVRLRAPHRTYGSSGNGSSGAAVYRYTGSAPWYHGLVSSAAAERRLAIHGRADGLFLLRLYSRAQSNHVLSLAYSGRVGFGRRTAGWGLTAHLIISSFDHHHPSFLGPGPALSHSLPAGRGPAH